MLHLPTIRHIVAVASGKGGVGKSTTAANLAVALATMGQSVGLLDADIYGPSQPRMMGVKAEKPESDGQKITPVMAHGVKVMSMGFLTEEESPMVWRGPLVQRALLQMTTDVVWGTEESPLDVLVIDMPPGTGDVQLTLAQQVPVSGAIIVSTPQDIALIDARKGLEMFNKTGVPVLGLVENMSVFCCPNCGHQTHLFGAHGAREMAHKLHLPLLAEIPLELDVREKTDAGQPVVMSAPDTAAAKAYRTLAEGTLKALQTQKTTPKSVKILME